MAFTSLHRFFYTKTYPNLLSVAWKKSSTQASFVLPYSTTASSISSTFKEWLLNAENNLMTTVHWLVFNQAHGLVYDYQQLAMPCPSTDSETELHAASFLYAKGVDKDSSNGKGVLEKSTTVVNGVAVEFTPDDWSHPQYKEIHAKWDEVEEEIAEYKRYHNADYHAERLALAYNFVHNPNATFVQLVTNLRMCLSCHAYMKAVAKLKQCEIVVRDANRIHRFDKSGQCSCKDHF